MKLLGISVAAPRTVQISGTPVSTGIFKEPVQGRVRVRALGLEGDGQADLENHGGIYKAVYSYPFEHYAYWAAELNRRDFVFGQFGENLTIEGLDEDQVRIGDQFRIGGVLLEVTQPRMPCFKLAHKMGRPDFIKRFARSGRTGFYQRVLTEGEFGAGDVIERVRTDPQGVTVRQAMNLMVFQEGGREMLEKTIGVPALTPGWREELTLRLPNP